MKSPVFRYLFHPFLPISLDHSAVNSFGPDWYTTSPKKPASTGNDSHHELQVVNIRRQNSQVPDHCLLSESQRKKSVTV